MSRHPKEKRKPRPRRQLTRDETECEMGFELFGLFTTGPTENPDWLVGGD